MKLAMYQVDAFASAVFSGNPAAVCLLEAWLNDRQLQAIAAENNLSETAFLVRNEAGFDLRWFTPVTEVELCGHATLASAFVLFHCRQWQEEAIRFRTRKSGELLVRKSGALLEMDFPARPPHAVKTPPGLCEALHVQPELILGSAEDILVVLDGEGGVRELHPDIAALGRVACRGVIVTARGKDADFVSRFFAPRVGVAEDPVPGSAHCVLIPYWSGVLGKRSLHAIQVSQRGGELFCEDCGDRVRIAGRAALYLEGAIWI